MAERRSIEMLTGSEDPAWPRVRAWVEGAVRPVEVLPPSTGRDEQLVALQVTTRSVSGALAYETGGLLVDHGWLRLLGGGHPRLSRSLAGWGMRSPGMLLVADDVAGGFFAVDGGALGARGRVHYLAPDTLRWEPLDLGHADFVRWTLQGRLDAFYAELRLAGWEREVAEMSAEMAWSFYPPLWSAEGRGGRGDRRAVPVEELWRLHARGLPEGPTSA